MGHGLELFAWRKEHLRPKKTLQSNWYEERMEPPNVTIAKDSVGMLPTKTAKTWSKTSEDFGGEVKEEYMRKVRAPDTENWLNYQRHEPSTAYQTTTRAAHCHPGEQSPAFNPPYIPEDKLTQYRSKWTIGDASRFEFAQTKQGRPRGHDLSSSAC